MVVGDFPSEEDERKGVPFSGPHGKFIQAQLRAAGIDPKDCHFTQVFHKRPPSNRVDDFCVVGKAGALPGYPAIYKNKYVKPEYLPHLERLDHEIETTNPNIILALGVVPFWALCRRTQIKKYRGSPLPLFNGSRKVIPTWDATSIFKRWELRVILHADLTKVRRESLSPILSRPSHILYLEPTLDDIASFYHDFMVGQPFLSADVETKMRQITEVGYATADGTRAIVIPFWDREQKDGNYWRSHTEEKEAWTWVRKINREFPLVGQNFQYDMQYFWKTVGIPCPKFLDDTMILHHSMQPELEKGLGFLASIYTDEPSWKFMRAEHETLKQDDF